MIFLYLFIGMIVALFAFYKDGKIEIKKKDIIDDLVMMVLLWPLVLISFVIYFLCGDD